jgi:outer membrane protein assembly factor BamB
MILDNVDAIERLDAYLDALARGDPAADEFETDLRGIDRRFRALDNAPEPRPGFAADLWDELVGGPLPAATLTAAPASAGRAAAAHPAGAIRPPRSTGHPRVRSIRRWASTYLATAALLAVTLGSVVVAFGGRQLAGLVNPPAPAEPRVSAGIVRGSSARTGVDPGPGPVGAPSVVWASATSEVSDVVVADGVVYTTLYDGTLGAFDAASGQERWRYDSGVRWVGNAPPLVAGGIVYAGLPDGYFYALDAADGTVRWRIPLSGGFDTAPALVDDTVYVTTGLDQSGGAITALDAANGAIRWRVAVEGGRLTAPTVFDGMVVVGAGGTSISSTSAFCCMLSTQVLALDAVTGAMRWQFETGGDIYSAPVAAGQTIYVGSGTRLWALAAADGHPRWQFRTPTNDPISGPPAVSGGRIFIAASNLTLYALDIRTGTERWRYKTGEFNYSPVGPTVVGGTVYIDTPFGDIFALDAATGAVFWQMTTQRAINAPPTVVNGAIYLSLGDGIAVLASPDSGKPDAP